MKQILINTLEIGDEWFEGESFLFTADSFKTIKLELEKESDRSIVLMSIAIIDSILSERIKRKCIIPDKKAIKQLFKPGGPFNTLSSKIEWLYCNGNITRELRDDIHIIRDMRNYCAHEWEAFTLSDSVDKKYMRKLNAYRIIQAQTNYILKKEKKEMTHMVVIPLRLQFIFMASILISSLNAQKTVAKPIEDIIAP
ncbi:MltR family transcriptional regulator [Zoogloea sp.]|uniref:MltR family transcriptional regulator n=1 Tax=Zoogloea sp. TaxID=49181 RepID=UPI001415AD55|nr:MAG: DUF4145 domain-containing protein [Zoogloea sp.]